MAHQLYYMFMSTKKFVSRTKPVPRQFQLWHQQRRKKRKTQFKQYSSCNTMGFKEGEETKKTENKNK